MPSNRNIWKINRNNSSHRSSVVFVVFLFLFLASFRHRFFFREFCQQRIVGGVHDSLLFETTPYCELWSSYVGSKLIASHLIEHSTVVSRRHVCRFDTISICYLLYNINLWSIYWLRDLKCTNTIHAMVLMNNDKNGNDPFNFAYRVRVVFCILLVETFHFSRSVHNEAHIPIGWMRRRKMKQNKNKEIFWICWKANIQMARRFKWLFRTETGSKSNYLPDVFKWISESIICIHRQNSSYVQRLWLVLSFYMTWKLLTVHFTKMLKSWAEWRRKRRRRNKLIIFFEYSKGNFEPIKWAYLQTHNWQSWFLKYESWLKSLFYSLSSYTVEKTYM